MWKGLRNKQRTQDEGLVRDTSEMLVCTITKDLSPHLVRKETLLYLVVSDRHYRLVGKTDGWDHL